MALGATPCKPRKIIETRLLLVEGKDEVRFFKALLNHMAVGGVQVEDAGGKDKFPDLFEAIRNDFDRVQVYGIVRDADTDSAAAFQSVVGVLQHLGEPAPDSSGVFAGRGGHPRKVGVYVLPGNGATDGMLESLCLASVSDHPVMPCVSAFMKCIEGVLAKRARGNAGTADVPLYPKNPVKAQATAFLAAMHDEAHHVGEAAEQKCWNFEHSCMAELKAFISELASA